MPGENKTIVIGESANRVISYARSIGAESFEPSASNLSTQQMWAENETWLINRLNSGYRVVDLGLDASRSSRGIFYPMENQTVAEWSSTTNRTVIYGTK